MQTAWVKDDLELRVAEPLVSPACSRGAHVNCSGSVLFGVLEAQRPEDVRREPCECSHHADPDADFKRDVARGKYPNYRTSRWAG